MKRISTSIIFLILTLLLVIIGVTADGPEDKFDNYLPIIFKGDSAVFTLEASSGSGLIERVYADKARYNPGDNATISVELDNQTGSNWSGTLSLAINHLENELHTAGQSASVSSGGSATKTFNWTVPGSDFQGYHVLVQAGSIDQAATAIDVSSDWTRYPRYGYVHDFSPGQSQSESETKINQLAQNYHINALQFYDWMWRHDQVISRTGGAINDPWYDWSGRAVSLDTTGDLIEAAHDVNAAAMPYMMLYAGLQGYEQISSVNPQWGLFSDTGHNNQLNFDFGDNDSSTNLWIFNPANPNWQNHIFRQADEAIMTAGFDGLHLDQMGNFWGSSIYDYWGNAVDLSNSLSPEINNAAEHINALSPTDPTDANLTFNMVNGDVDVWGVDDVIDNANLDFFYSEIWENGTYHADVYEFVRDVRERTNKAIVLAAYINFDQPVTTRYEAEAASLNNVGTNSNHGGYTGAGFVDGYGQSGDYVEFEITVPEAGDYALAFRYANNTGGAVTRSVYVNGSDDSQLQFPDLATWATWGVARHVAALTGGDNTIKLARDGDDSGFINLDHLYVYREETSLKYEAESATLNGANTNTNHLDFTGSGFVEGYGDSGDSVQFSINVPETGKYGLTFRYANDTGSTATRSVYVDGVDQAQIEFLDQSSWDEWAGNAYHLADLTAGSHTIKLARDGDDSGFINLDNLTLGTFDEDSVRLANAAFAASGAFHIELGEGDQMLGHPYFPNQSLQMRSSLSAAMKDQYDFITAYENLLFDPDIHFSDAGSQWLDISSETLSGDASAGTIWFINKRNDDYDVIHLINLLDNDSVWRNVASAPPAKTNLAVKYYMGPDVTVSGVYLASPDIDHGQSQSLSYSTGSDGSGDYVSFTLPSLEYWDMIYIKRTFNAPSNDRYEAEAAILTNTGTNSNHSGYSGAGFVDGFAEQNDGVSFFVYAEREDDYVLRFRYANSTGSTATRQVYVDGEPRGIVHLANLANWDTWGDGSLTTRLSPGLHQIVLWYEAANNHAVNLDYLQIDPAYVWNFETKVDRLPEDYYLTFKVGLPGFVHWGVDNWNNVTDTWFVKNGSADGEKDYEATIGPFSGDTEINFTFKWDDNDDGSADRWEGEDWSIGANAPAKTFFQTEGTTGNNYSFAQFDARGSLFDFMVPLGMWSGIKVNSSIEDGAGAQINLNKSVAGLKVGSAYYWLNDESAWSYSQHYVTDTNTLKTVATHKSEPLKVTAYAFSPKNITYPTDSSSSAIRGLLVQRFIVENTGGSSQDVAFLYFHDMDINGSNDNDSVTYKSAEKALYYHDPGDSGSGRNRTLDFGLALKSSASGTDLNKLYQITDAAYLGRAVTLSASGSETFDLLLAGATSPSTGQDLYNSTIKKAVDWFDTANVASLRTTTEDFWGDLLDQATTFESPDETYNNVFRRSILASYLYFDAEKGGVGAGSYNGAYFFTWPRDAVYAAVTADKIGLHDIAEKVYDWLWNVAERDTSANDIDNDGKYYRFWYQKYTMDGGREWINPQIDETAIIPWGAWYHYRQTGDGQFLTDYKDMVKEAGLVSSENNDHAGLDYSESKKLMFSMNLWEDKWGMFLYTNANVYAGLRDGASFLTAAGDSATAGTFNSRAGDIKTGLDGLYSAGSGYYGHAFEVKLSHSDPAIVNHDLSADVSMLGLVTPFKVEPVTGTKVINTLAEVEAALTDFSETKMAYGGVTRYRADQEERYGSDYRDLGDKYFDGGPWMMPTNWLSEYYLEWADTGSGKSKTDAAKAYLDYVIGYLGNLGLGAEQIDENKSADEFALETAWANLWESNSKIIDNMMAFIDYEYDAPNDAITVSPKLPTGWGYLGSHIQIKDGDLYIKVTENSGSQTTVNLDNNSANDLTVNIYVQTDAAPNSVTGAGLSWGYDSVTGRVKLSGTLARNTTSTITINH